MWVSGEKPHFQNLSQKTSLRLSVRRACAGAVNGNPLATTADFFLRQFLRGGVAVIPGRGRGNPACLWEIWLCPPWRRGGGIRALSVGSVTLKTAACEG